jgi:UDP-glucose:glycoprotein glucosyltransferase
MQGEVGNQLQFLQEQVSYPCSSCHTLMNCDHVQVYMGLLSDSIEDVSVYFYDLPTSAKRRNRYIFPTNKPGASLRVVCLPEVFAQTGYEAISGSYVHAGK